MVIVFVLLAVVIGCLLIRLASPANQLQPYWAAFLLELALGAGGGIALISFLFFLLLLLHVASPVVILFAEAVLLLGSAGLVFIRHRRTAEELHRRVHCLWWYWLLSGALAVSVLTVSAAIAKLAQTDPYGYWDAVAIWNLRAQYLAGPGDTWTRAFSPLLVFSHPDYPLLIPGFVAQLWKLSGGETPTLAPILTAAVFAAAVLALLLSTLALVRSTGSALLASLTLMTSSSYLIQPMSQYADVPLSFYFLATLALVFLSANSDGTRKLALAALAGGFASFAAWTKNEGLVFFVLSLGCYAFVLRRYKSVENNIAPAWYFLLGALPGLLVVAYFKAFLAPRNSDLMDQTVVQAMHKLVEFDRYVIIAKSLIWIALNRLGDWWTHPLLVLVILAALLRFRISGQQIQGVLTVGLTLGLMFASYLGAYLITTMDLRFQLATSLERFCAQVWPSFLFWAFLVLTSPEEALFSPKGEANFAHRVH